MKRLLTTSIAFILFFCAQGQLQINYGAGFSSHGSGDLPGYSVQTSVQIKPNNRLSYSINARHTNNARELGLYFTDPSTRQDANSSYRMVTSGFQLEFLTTIRLAKSKKLSFLLGAGGLVRYQFSNDVTRLAFLYPAATGYPIPLLAIDVDTKKFKYATVGYVATIGFDIKFSPKSAIGLRPTIQNDTYGNII